MTTVAVVLGAGGITGAAYHSGVLTALAEAGFDARNADLLVGTSAGSGVAATLRAGVPPLDLALRSLGRPISAEAAAIVGTGTPPTFDLRPRPTGGVPRPSSPGLFLRAVRHPAKALAGMMPAGTISADAIGERMSSMYRGVAWPSRPLWVCAVDLESGDRVVFGRDDTAAPIGTAVQASSSIPGFFRPVVHGGRRYVDGGVHSPTNADLVADGSFDLVVVVSPMSATSEANRRARPSGRRLHALQLAREVRTIRESGSAVLTFQPTVSDVAAMGDNAMDPNRRAAATTAALASARTRLADPAIGERLELLRSVA